MEAEYLPHVGADTKLGFSRGVGISKNQIPLVSGFNGITNSMLSLHFLNRTVQWWQSKNGSLVFKDGSIQSRNFQDFLSAMRRKMLRECKWTNCSANLPKSFRHR